jgi:hypothetical protein
MIFNEIQRDAENLPLWAKLNKYTRPRVEEEMEEYVIDLCSEGKIDMDAGYALEWYSDTTYMFTFCAADDHGTQVVYFAFDHLTSANGTDSSTNDAYDRAMKGI